MEQARVVALFAGLVVLWQALPAFAALQPVDKTEESAWLRWLIPLPKQIAFQAKVQLPASEIGLRVVGDVGEVGQTVAQELRELFTTRAGADLTGDSFEIVMGLCDAEGKVGGLEIEGAAALPGLPNAEQAYIIRPVGESELVLAARAPAGLYYAAQTLRQLLGGKFEGAQVTVPLVSITDWPDLAERGQWGGSANDDIEWMAAHKMNLVESHVSLSVTPEGRGVAKLDEGIMRRARAHALKFVPIITHLDQLAMTGIYTVFPELKGQGKSAALASAPSVVGPCASNPKFTAVLADWMIDLAGQEGVTDLCAWLSENAVQCECDACRQAGQFTLETRAIVNAWRQAREKYPKLGLRILLTQGSYPTNDRVLAEAPPEVGITYYDGGRTYDSSRDPMIYPLLEEFAASGRWLGCYPQLTASWRIVCPWSGPQFVKYRMTEFVNKKLQCLCGYLTPNRKLYDFNFTAGAEWSWNASGRDEREFAAAWATRRGLKDPEAAAEWAVTLGPIGWDVYGSRVPYSAFFGGAAQMIQKRTAPTLGKGMFRYFETVERFDEDLAACDKALSLAQSLGAPDIVAETLVVRGYVQMLKSIHAIALRVSGGEDLSDQERAALQEEVGQLVAAGLQVCDKLCEWEASIEPGIGGSRFVDTVDVTEKTVSDIADALAPFGVENTMRPYLRSQVGTWVSEDFEENERITKRWEVTKLIDGPGRYTVGFKYTSGWWGLRMYRVALASAPADAPEKLTEVAVDEHEGEAAYRNKDNTYTLEVKAHDPQARYFLVAHIKGVRSSDKDENRRGCEGEVWMRKVMPEGAP
ncbi:MAG: glycoside hydrolase family 20 zincin-like fold domain-containing protein [Armatimonadota bacterium]